MKWISAMDSDNALQLEYVDFNLHEKKEHPLRKSLSTTALDPKSRKQRPSSFQWTKPFQQQQTSDLNEDVKDGQRHLSLPRKGGSIAVPKGLHVNSNYIEGSLTLWDYLLLELTDSGASLLLQEKTEQLVNIIKIPAYLEHVMIFGVMTCLDSFLYTFTILPLRFCYSVYVLLINQVNNLAGLQPGARLSTARKADLRKGFILIVVLFGLLELDTSRIYHGIRGQSAIKLYVMFNVLEIADKLCCALGQDIIECLFSLSTLSEKSSKTKFLLFTILAMGYCFGHSLILLYQIITLNVAVNSYSNALLTLLLSNQFSEIKSSVFKKFARESLFQLTCADITERFQLLAMLLVIGLRNLVEVNNAGLIPMSWAGWNRWIGAMFGPALVVVGSEVVVDWLKHAYITKFNNIRPRIYRKFLDVLTMDYAENAFADQIMTKRTGLPVLPLAAVFVRMLLQSYSIFIEQSQSSTTSNAASTTFTLASSPSAIIALEKIDAYLNFMPGRSGYSTAGLYWSLNFILLATCIFVVVLGIKLVMGLLLFNFASQRYIKSRSRHRKFQQPRLPDSDFMAGNFKELGVIELEDKMRTRLYDAGEEHVPQNGKSVPPEQDLSTVTRFSMYAKRIW